MAFKSQFSLLLFLSLLTLLPACSIVKILSVLNGGEVVEKYFHAKVNFERRLGLMVVLVIIDGEQYDFLLDTGSPTVVSTELAAKLNLPILAEQHVADSQQAQEGMFFSRVPSITLGGIAFTNIGVAITDLNASTDITCLEIDGLLGANFLRKAEWNFNYKESRIEFASSLDAFEMDTETLEVPLKFTLTKTPVMTVRLGEMVKERRVAVDLGSNGGFSLGIETFRSILEESPQLPYGLTYGISGGGLYDKNLIDTTYSLKIPELSFGDVLVNNMPVAFEAQEMSTVGSGFFEDYDVVISWRKGKMWLLPNSKSRSDPTIEYGLSFAYTNGQLIVRQLDIDSDAARLLEVGDHVVAWAGRSYEGLTQEGYCAFLHEFGPYTESVLIEVERASERLKYSIGGVE